MKRMSTAQAICSLFDRLLTEHDDLVLLGESVGRGGGIGGSTSGLQATHGPQRVIDTPVADRATLGLAVGLAMAGRRAVVEISASGRIPAVLEVLAEAASVAAQKEFTVPLVVRIPCGGQAGHRVDRPAAELLAAVDGLQVICPSDPESLLASLNAAMQTTSPLVILEPRVLYRQRCTIEEDSSFSIHQARLLRHGEHVTLASWGSGVRTALGAAETLENEGISAAVLDLVTLSPLDLATLGERVRATGRLVCVEAPEGGLATRILNATLQQAFLYLEAPLASSDAAPDDVVQAARNTVLY